MSDGTITLTFVHPTNLSETLTANVSDSATPQYLIDQLIAASFIPPANSVGQYKLRTEDGTQLLDDQSIGTAGLGEQAQLNVNHSVTGA